MKLPGPILVLMFAIQSPFSPAQQVVHIREENLPGKLESFFPRQTTKFTF